MCLLDGQLWWLDFHANPTCWEMQNTVLATMLVVGTVVPTDVVLGLCILHPLDCNMSSIGCGVLLDWVWRAYMCMCYIAGGL